jgi:hypothetical protein
MIIPEIQPFDPSLMAVSIANDVLEESTGKQMWSHLDNKQTRDHYFYNPALFLNGGADGTRTRDPRRDRPVF